MTNTQMNQLLLNQLKHTNALQSAQAQFHHAAQVAAVQQTPVNNWFYTGAGLVASKPPEFPAPPPKLPISTRFGEIIGFRFWNYYRGFLKSASRDYVWMPGKVAGLEEGQKLEDYGGAGVHAFKAQDYMVLQSYEGDLVFGTVKLWGDVIEYERGYHAEFASILSLDHIDLPDDRDFQLQALADLRQRYNIQKEK